MLAWNQKVPREWRLSFDTGPGGLGALKVSKALGTSRADVTGSSSNASLAGEFQSVDEVLVKPVPCTTRG